MPDQSEFITHFEVSNFKKFDHLVVENIGQFNLITGDNNVGKTCLLEALMIPNANLWKLMLNLQSIVLAQQLDKYTIGKEYLTRKELSDNFLEVIKKDKELSIKLSLNRGIFCDFEIIDKKIIDFDEYTRNAVLTSTYAKNLKFNLDDIIVEILNHSRLQSRQFLYEGEIYKIYHNINSKDFLSYYPIIRFNNSLFNNGALSEFYYSSTNSPYSVAFNNSQNKKKLVKFLEFIIPDIVDIELEKDNRGFPKMILISSISSHEQFVNITRYGDGVQKSLRYILELFCSKELGYDYLFIDEIDTGIHFSNMKELWKNLLSAFSELEMQLFATTHSQECIEAYAQALEELGMEEKGRLIEMEEHQGKVYASTLSYENIKAGLISNTNLRGA